jgi:hypothetical protein
MLVGIRWIVCCVYDRSGYPQSIRCRVADHEDQAFGKSLSKKEREGAEKAGRLESQEAGEPSDEK